MTYDVPHRPPLTVRLEALRMRRITGRGRRGQFFPDPELFFHFTIKVNREIVYDSVLKANTMFVHASNRVTCQYGVENRYIFVISDPQFACLL